MRDAIRITTTVLLTISAVAIVWQFWGIVLLLFVSLAVAAMMRDPIDWLVRRNVSRGLAVGIVLLIGLTTIALVVFIVAPVLIQRVPLLVEDFSFAYTQLKQELSQSGTIQRMLSTRLPDPETLFGSVAGSESGGLVQAAINVTTNLLDVVLQSITVIFLAVYWSIDRTYFERLWLSLLPPDQRTRMRRVWRAIELDVGAYLRSEILQCLLGGCVLFAVFFLLGIKYPVTLAFVVAVAWLLPVIGPLVAIVPVMAIALINSPLIALVATILMLIVYASMQLYVERRLYHSARFASVISLLLMLILVDAMGVVGLIVAPILASIAQIALTILLSEEAASAASIDIVSIKTLTERVQQLHLAMQNSSSATPPATANLANRLEKLVKQIENLAQ